MDAKCLYKTCFCPREGSIVSLYHVMMIEVHDMIEQTLISCPTKHYFWCKVCPMIIDSISHDFNIIA